MKFLSEKGSQRRYITAGKVLADIPAPKIARRVTAKPQSTLDGTKRLRAKSRSTPVTEPNLADLRAARKVLTAYIREMNGETIDHDHLLIEARNALKSIVELLSV